MHAAPFDERIDLYAFLSAKLHFQFALDSLNEVSKNESSDWRYQAFFTSFAINYGKPFKEQRDKSLKRGLRLDETLIPPKHLATHETILCLRDKMVAHTDLSGFNTDSGEPVNALYFVVEHRSLKSALTSLRPKPGTCEKYQKHLRVLIRIVTNKSTNLLKKWGKLGLDDGSIWKLNLSKESDDMLIPLHRYGVAVPPPLRLQ